MRLERVYESIESLNIGVNLDDLKKFDKEHVKVMNQIVVEHTLESFTEKSVKRIIVDFIAYDRDYDRYVRNWGNCVDIDHNFYNKVYELSQLIQLNLNAITIGALDNLKLGIMTQERSNSSFVGIKMEEMTSIVCNKFRSHLNPLKEVLSMDLSLDEEHLIFLSIFLKICVNVKSSLGFSCICYISAGLLRPHVSIYYFCT